MIRRRQFGANHAYYDRDPVSGDDVKVPGVTTILNDAIPKGGLKYWAAEQAAQYAVTHWDELGGLGLLERAKLIERQWERERDTLSVRGTQVHTLAEQLAHGAEVDVPEPLAGHVEACVAFLDAYDVQPVLTEAVVINRSVPYAGTLDLIADMRGERWLLDWKTGKNVYADTALQLAAYRHAEHYLDAEGVEQPLAAIGIERAAVVHLRADGYDVYPMDSSERAYLVFRHAAYMARWLHYESSTRSTRLDAMKGPALSPAEVDA